jgi:E3 ubiquitin-protein ligase HUWE1
LYGLLGNPSLCKDFIEGGLDLILQIPNLPCIPVAYTGTDLHSATTSLFRVIGEYDHVKLLEKVNSAIKQDLEDTKTLWQPATTDWTDNEDVKKLPSAAVRLSYISDILATMSFHHVRTATGMMRSFGVTSGSSFLADVAALHRASFREHAKFRAPSKATTDLATALLGLDETPSTTTRTSAQFLATRVHAVCTKLFKGELERDVVKVRD